MQKFLKNLFNRKAPEPLTPTEQLLVERNVKYKKQPDGTLTVRRDLDLSFQRLSTLPDLSSVVVEGNFNCGYNELTSLAGAPRRVGGEFRCKGNRLSDVGMQPLTFGSLATDYGTYNAWDGVPLWLRLDNDGKRRLVESTPAGDLSQLNSHLIWAVRTRDAALTRLCIDKGADVNCENGTPLMMAAQHENLDIAGVLALAGADVEKAITTARNSWQGTIDCDDGQLIITNGTVYDRNKAIDKWLSAEAGALREKIQARKIEELQQANAGLQQRVATLQAEAEAPEKPIELDKPKRPKPTA